MTILRASITLPFHFKNLSMNKIYILGLLFCMTSCSEAVTQTSGANQETSMEFNDYWYDGTAEITRYELDQARYGEMRSGEAVLIFVTEDFRKDKQVKYEGGDRKNVVPILKLNFTKKFFTGIYPYSIMTSVFSSIENSETLKINTSSQEWCGHTFSQLNLKNNKYEGALYSYFQNEGDEKYIIDNVLLEDEIWTLLRINPDGMPVGNIDIYPGTQFLRLKHKDNKVEKATAKLATFKDDSISKVPMKVYSINYADLDRKLEIIFEAEFPYKILGWNEEVLSGFGNSKMLTTRARRTHEIKSAYWSQNRRIDEKLKKDLGLNGSNY